MEVELQEGIKKGLIHFATPTFFWDTVNKKVSTMTLEEFRDITKPLNGVKQVSMFTVYVKDSGLSAFLKRHEHQNIIFLKTVNDNVVFPDGRIRVWID